MKETYLVLGSSSFYGRNFADLVEEKGQNVIRLQRPEWHIGDPIPSADYVVNFVSESLVEESWLEPEKWCDTNLTKTTTLIKQCLALPIKKFIHVSTPEVYGSTPTWVAENRHFNPSTPYAVSRAAGDFMLLAFWKAYGFPVCITRTSNIYGDGQEKRIIPLALKSKELSLHGGGKTIRGFIHVKDACEGLWTVAQKGKIGETYHIATRSVVSIRELVKMIGCKIGPDIEDRRGKDLKYMLDSTKLRALGWKHRTVLAEWVKNAIS